MKAIRITSLALFVIAGVLIFAGIKASRTPMFEKNPNVAYVTGTITANSFSSSKSGMQEVYRDEYVTLLKPGTSRVSFVKENGLRFSGTLSYCFLDMPENGNVKIAYDKRNMFRFGVAGYDETDMRTAIFLWCFAGIFGIYALCAVAAAFVLSRTEGRRIF